MTHLLLLGAIVIWGWTFVATKICLGHMSPVQLVAIRFALGAPVLFLIARARRARFGYAELLRPIAIATTIFSLHFLIQTSALELTTATNTGWIVGASPLTIAIMAALILKEPIPRAMRVGIVLATLGVILLVSRGELTSLDWLASAGDWLVVVSTVTWALYTIATRNLSRARDPVVIALAVTIPLALAALVLPFVLGSWAPVSSLPADTLGALVFLGVFGVALAQWFWQVGVSKLGAARAGSFLYLEPLATTVVAVPYLGEPFGFAAAIGGILVLAGVYIAQRAGS